MNQIKSDFFLEELVNLSPELIVSTWILDRIPFPFNGDSRMYDEWRLRLAAKIGVDASEVVIIGSGAFGISLNPNKNFRAFDGKSDIDGAIVSEHYFNVAWHCLRYLGSKRHSMPPPAKQSV